MKYLALIIRILIVVIGVKMMSLSGWTPATPPFCTGVGFILVALYLGLQAIVGPKAMTCPILGKCGKKECCSTEK